MAGSGADESPRSSTHAVQHRLRKFMLMRIHNIHGPHTPLKTILKEGKGRLSFAELHDLLRQKREGLLDTLLKEGWINRGDWCDCAQLLRFLETGTIAPALALNSPSFIAKSEAPEQSERAQLPLPRISAAHDMGVKSERILPFYEDSSRGQEEPLEDEVI